MQDKMVRISMKHPFKSLKGRVGLVVLEGELTAIVLFQFSEPHNQMASEIGKPLLQIVNAPRIEEYIHYDEASRCFNQPVEWKLTMGPLLKSRIEEPWKDQLIRMRPRKTVICAGDDEETWVLSLDQGARSRVLKDRFELNGHDGKCIAESVAREVERLEHKRMVRLLELQSTVGLNQPDAGRLGKLKRKHRCLLRSSV